MRFVLDPIYGDHLRGVGHPESPDRVEVVASHLQRLGAIGEALPARDATDEELERVHTAPYLELVKRETSRLNGARYLSTGDVVVDERSLAVARRAAGGAHSYGPPPSRAGLRCTARTGQQSAAWRARFTRWAGTGAPSTTG